MKLLIKLTFRLALFIILATSINIDIKIDYETIFKKYEK